MAKKNQLWSLQEDFVLMTLVGRETHEKIAQRLGRTASAVQRRASEKGWHAKAERRATRTYRSAQNAAKRGAYLTATEEELSEFLPQVD